MFQSVQVESNEEWRRQILDGVDVIQHQIRTGRLSIWGEKTAAIVSSETHESEILIAAAELGRGRIFIAAHSEYAKAFKVNDQKYAKLFSNIRRWLTKGRDNANDVVNARSSTLSLEKGKIAVQEGGDISAERAAEILKFVENGGSYFYGTSPWTYHVKITSRRKHIYKDEATKPILTAAGISWRKESFPNPQMYANTLP